ncbi:hypothetical protein ACWDPF_05685 [Streptomyces albogriseolus]
MRARAAGTSARAEREGLVLHGFSRRVADGLVRGQDRRRAEHRIRTAHLPRERSLREFDYSADPNVDPAVIHNSPPASGSPRVTRRVLYRHIVVEEAQDLSAAHWTCAAGPPGGRSAAARPGRCFRPATVLSADALSVASLSAACCGSAAPAVGLDQVA